MHLLIWANWIVLSCAVGKYIVKKENKINENNLVLFTSSKNYPVVDEELFVDPLQELLDEFSDIEIDLDEEFDDFALNQGIDDFSPLMDRGQKVLLAEKIALLQDTQQRIKYLLDEIELYLPRKW